jgi:septum site-determining protein MinC
MTAPNELKTQTLAFVALVLHDSSLEAIEKILIAKTNEYKSYFYNSPLIINIADVDNIPDIKDIEALTKKYNFVLVGFSGVTRNDIKGRIFNAGYTVFNAAAAKDLAVNQQPAPAPAQETVKTVTVVKEVEVPAAPAQENTMYCATSLHSGESKYAKGQSLLIIGDVPRGSEVKADYNIQIEGKLYGRACSGLAGLAEGKAIESHITCTDFDPELVSVSGVYKYGDSFPEEYYHQAVHVRCENDQMKYEILNSKKN